MTPAIKNIEGLTMDELEDLVMQGGRFVMFQYAVSIVVMTFKRPTDIYFIPPGESAVGKHAGYTVLSLILGWWGLPWGPIYTISSLATNLRGGKDLTHAVMGHLRAQNPSSRTSSIFDVLPEHQVK